MCISSLAPPFVGGQGRPGAGAASPGAGAGQDEFHESLTFSTVWLAGHPARRDRKIKVNKALVRRKSHSPRFAERHEPMPGGVG